MDKNGDYIYDIYYIYLSCRYCFEVMMIMSTKLTMCSLYAGFFQDTLAELAKEQKKFAQIRKHDADDASDAESIEIEKEATAISFLEFLKKARTGESIPPDVIIKFAKYFEDNLTLDNMGRMQLINMCKYVSRDLSLLFLCSS